MSGLISAKKYLLLQIMNKMNLNLSGFKNLTGFNELQ